ncbi:MAG: glycosyltransferase family 2 protein, partial [Saprospiraceae bacterium]
VLQNIKYNVNSDDFIFDNEMLSQIIYKGYDIAEVTCPTKYFEEASSINFTRSSKYGLGVLRVSVVHLMSKIGLVRSRLY